MEACTTGECQPWGGRGHTSPLRRLHGGPVGTQSSQASTDGRAPSSHSKMGTLEVKNQGQAP